MGLYPGLAAAQQRSDQLDVRVAELAARLDGPVTIVALGAYGRRELTPRADAELLFLHTGNLDVPHVTQTVCYPLWEQAFHVEPIVRTIDECVRDTQRSWSVAARFLDARLVAGDGPLFESLSRRLQPWRRDRERLRHRLRSEAQHRYATHPSATSSATPDLVAGRGGLADIQALRWLDADTDILQALNFLLTAQSEVEDIVGHVPHHLSARVIERLQREDDAFLEKLYGHARWVNFNLESALTPGRDDRQLGPNLALRRGVLVAERPPPLERAPSMGLRIANLVGLAPPSSELLDWARGIETSPLHWDESTLEQFWLFLRAADWRAWDFLDVSGLLVRYLPEVKATWRKPGSTRTGDLALDHHSFLALRCLHEWTESDDLFAVRAWRWLRHRDWVYLAVLFHELTSEEASNAARRLGLPDNACETISMVVATYQQITDTATRRDLHDEDLVFELATRIATRQRLSTAFLIAVAHEMACGATAWSAWKADLIRQLFGHLEIALRQAGEVGARRTRSLEHHRERIVRQLQRRNLYALAPLVARLPRRYVLTHTPAFAARHLALLGRQPLGDGEVRMQAYRRRPELWDVLIVAHDRPGLLATVAGVLALRGASVLAADAATSADGLVLDVFTVSSAATLQWSQVEADLQKALQGHIPLDDLLGSRPMQPEDAESIHVAVDNAASEFFNVVEVRAPDQVGLLYRIASALHAEHLDIHHARIATYPEGALDVFYVRDLSGEKLAEPAALVTATALAARLRGNN